MKEYYNGLKIAELEYKKRTEINRETIADKELMETFPNLTLENI